MLSRRGLTALRRNFQLLPRAFCASQPPPPPPNQGEQEKAITFLGSICGGTDYTPQRNVFQNILRNFIHHPLSMRMLRSLVPGFFPRTNRVFEEEIVAGGKDALEYLQECLHRGDFNSLESATEGDWFERIHGEANKLGITDLTHKHKELDTREIFWKLHSVSAAKLDTLFCVIGATRGDSLRKKKIFVWSGQCLVMDESEVQKIDKREMVNLLCSFVGRGMIAVADVDLQVEQTFYIKDRNTGEIIQGSEKPEKVRHFLRLEMPLNPKTQVSQEFRPTSTPHPNQYMIESFEPGSWTLVDCNWSHEGNFPLKGFLDPVEEEVHEEEGEKAKNESEDRNGNEKTEKDEKR